MDDNCKKVNLCYLWTVLVSIGLSFLISLTSIGDRIPYVALIIGDELLLAVPALIYVLSTRGRRDSYNDMTRSLPAGRLIGLRPLSGATILLLIVLTWLMTPLLSLLNTLSLFVTKNQVSSEVMTVLDETPLWLAVIGLALVPAVVEEFIMRGVIYYSAYRHVSPLRGAILTGFLFGLLHMNLNQFVYAFAMGFIFCMVVEATDSLLSSMLMHLLFNLDSVILAYAAEKLGGATGKLSSELESGMADAATTNMLVPVAIGLAVAAVVCTILGYLLYRTIAGINGRGEVIASMLSRKQKTTWEASTDSFRFQDGRNRFDEQNFGSSSRLADPILYLAMAICIGVIILNQFSILFS